MASTSVKVIIAGGRALRASAAQFDEWVRPLLERHDLSSLEIVSGGASGADAMGCAWAHANKVPVRVFRAEWDVHGRAAGPIRNREMAQYADELIAVWDGKSPGTKNMINEARAAGLVTHIVPI